MKDSVQLPTTNRFFLSPPSPKPSAKARAFHQAVSSLLQAGVIVPVPTAERFRGFYSNLFAVPKKGGSVRPILDLKHLNKYVWVCHFRTESLRSTIASMEKGEYLASMDMQDAYLHIPIAPAHQRFLRFAIDQDHYQFVAFPFGLATAPRVFTKVMAATMDVLHSRGIVVVPYPDEAATMDVLHSRGIVLVPYPDDLLIKAPAFNDCELSVSITNNTLSRMGWLVNLQRSSPTLSQSLTFLGMLDNTSRGLVPFPRDKALALRLEVRILLRKPLRSLRFAMRVPGRMGAAIKWSHLAQFHLRPLQLAILRSWDRNPVSSRQGIPANVVNQEVPALAAQANLASKEKSFLTGQWKEDAQEEFGWKLVHGDIFRPPKKGMLLSVFLGQGTQIFIMTFITLSFGGEKWKSNVLLTALLCPG
ncbi:unnamed protein product [Ranitomeya imitator]|uniref:ribonuclease H n=1 Tax=Ranitomeya imitator TaxID=111125 RepID=A0ABN9LQH9_9NEOB|nr:unnamed protein product [Ranitomeya imitator]